MSSSVNPPTPNGGRGAIPISAMGIRYVSVVIPPNGPAWVDYVGTPGESSEYVGSTTEKRLTQWCGGPHHCLVHTMSYSAACRAYGPQLRRYEAFFAHQAAILSFARLMKGGESASM